MPFKSLSAPGKATADTRHLVQSHSDAARARPLELILPDTRQVRVASFNLCGWNRGGRLLHSFPERVRRIAEHIAERGLDVVGLQEVCRDHGEASGAHAVVACLGSMGHRGYHALFTATHSAGLHRDEGLAIITRLPIDDTASCRLGSLPGLHPRRCLWARISSPLGSLLFVTAHLTFQWTPRGFSSRACEILSLRERLEALAPGTDLTLVSGDFNMLPGSRAYALMTEPSSCGRAFKDTMPQVDGNATYPTFAPFLRLDYMFQDSRSARELGIGPMNGGRIFRKPHGGKFLSDHLGLELTLGIPASCP